MLFPCVIHVYYVLNLANMHMYDAFKMIIRHNAVQFSLFVQTSPLQNHHKVLEGNEDAVILKVQIHQSQVSVATCIH